jgi:hypothetical protein
MNEQKLSLMPIANHAVCGILGTLFVQSRYSRPIWRRSPATVNPALDDSAPHHGGRPPSVGQFVSHRPSPAQGPPKSHLTARRSPFPRTRPGSPNSSFPVVELIGPVCDLTGSTVTPRSARSYTVEITSRMSRPRRDSFHTRSRSNFLSAASPLHLFKHRPGDSLLPCQICPARRKRSKQLVPLRSLDEHNKCGARWGKRRS